MEDTTRRLNLILPGTKVSGLKLLYVLLFLALLGCGAVFYNWWAEEHEAELKWGEIWGFC
jgi:hypothetical protein